MPSHRRNGTISINLLPEISSYDCCQKQAHLSKGDHMDQTKTSFLSTAISAIRATRFLPPPLVDLGDTDVKFKRQYNVSVFDNLVTCYILHGFSTVFAD